MLKSSSRVRVVLGLGTGLACVLRFSVRLG